MGIWVKQSEDRMLPKWLTDKLRQNCECGNPIINYKNDNGYYTARKCSNDLCPYHMAQKVVLMCDVIGAQGVGPKTAYNVISAHKLTNHLQTVPYLFREKPKVTLYAYLRACCIEGIDRKWQEVADKFDTVKDMYNGYKGALLGILEENRQLIEGGVQYFDFDARWKPKYEPIVEGTVMISGNLKGFGSRNDFIVAINRASDGLITFNVAENKRKTGIYALIQEEDTPNRGKAECALENNIPILTPKEFETKVITELQEKIRNGRKMRECEY